MVSRRGASRVSWPRAPRSRGAGSCSCSLRSSLPWRSCPSAATASSSTATASSSCTRDALGDSLCPRAGRPPHQDASGGHGQLARPRLHRGAPRRRCHRIGQGQRRPRGRAGAQVWPAARLRTWQLGSQRDDQRLAVHHHFLKLLGCTKWKQRTATTPAPQPSNTPRARNSQVQPRRAAQPFPVL